MPYAVAAIILMILAGISDLFDGHLARRWRVVSTFGKMADPLMDKVFFLWIVYAIEVFLICLNVYSSIVYTKAYWPYMLRAIRS